MTAIIVHTAKAQHHAKTAITASAHRTVTDALASNAPNIKFLISNIQKKIKKKT